MGEAVKDLECGGDSLADELANLSEELVSTVTAGPSQPSLLEEIEALHRSLKELESVKAYVRVVHQATRLRSATLL